MDKKIIVDKFNEIRKINRGTIYSPYKVYVLYTIYIDENGKAWSRYKGDLYRDENNDR